MFVLNVAMVNGRSPASQSASWCCSFCRTFIHSGPYDRAAETTQAVPRGMYGLQILRVMVVALDTILFLALANTCIN